MKTLDLLTPAECAASLERLHPDLLAVLTQLVAGGAKWAEIRRALLRSTWRKNAVLIGTAEGAVRFLQGRAR